MKNLVKVEVSGLNINAFFNALITKGVNIYNLSKNAKCNFEFEIINKKYLNFVKICKIFNIKYKILRERVAVQLTNFVVKKLGFVLAFVLCFACCFAFSNKICMIDVCLENETEELSNFVVLDFLNQKGICVGMDKDNVISQKVENELRSAFDNLTNVVVFKKGVCLFVQAKVVKEKTVNGQNKIVATRSGVVEKLHLLCGEAKAKVGDFVKEGDVLVEPDKNGVCDANILLRTWVEEKQTLALEKMVWKETGRVVIFKNYCVCGKTLGNEKECNFETFAKTENVVCVSENLLLPICIKTTTFVEKVCEREMLDVESSKNMLTETLKNGLDDITKDAIEIISTKLDIIQQNNMLLGVAKSEIIIKI